MCAEYLCGDRDGPKDSLSSLTTLVLVCSAQKRIGDPRQVNCWDELLVEL
jgi:hypothetical protein